MFKEYNPFFYVNIDAENNNTFYAENPNDNCARKDCEGVVYKLGGHDAEIEIISESFPGTDTVRQRTVIKNTGEKPFTVDLLSSLYQTNAGVLGEEDRYIIHFAESAWQGEAQWRHISAKELGLYTTYNHGTHTSVRFESKTSYTTARYEPVIMLEDTVLRKTWAFEIDPVAGWFIDISVRGYRKDTAICVLLSGANEKNDGWFRTLAPGESYETCPAAVCLVDGGFEEAAAELAKYHRAIMKNPFPGGITPLCFNDYMNCIWALPNKEKSLPLIDAAAEAGAEYYVIDAGWFGSRDQWALDLGDWFPNNERFGEGGLQGIIDYIISKGMKPGIWLELESINMSSAFAKAHPDCVLKRHGSIIGGSVGFFDFRKKEVQDYVTDTFDRLYNMGVRFVKNDYNQSTGVGIDGGLPSIAANLEEHGRIFLEVIDKITAKYPDFIIENCGSGAMRSDMGTLSHFYLQSSSDQEDYWHNPSIISGTEVCMPPERCGIWAYPYPSPIDDRLTFERSEEFKNRFKDGRATAYNMVTGLMGLMYLSGRIDCADTFNMRLIKEACALYKELRKTVAGAVPVFPLGTFDMSAKGIICYGLCNKAVKRLLLAVWAQDGTENEKLIDLCKYGENLKIIRQYPELPGTGISADGGFVRVQLPGEKSAVFAELEVS